MISTQPYKVALGGFHITGGGTSASAPVVAGIAALYLQMNPTASWSDVKTAMTSCAGQDQFTWGPLPNNAWGYGKADAFAMLTNCGPVNIQPILKDVSIKSYPNPASGIIDIELLNGTSGNSRISVSDLTGKVIREFNVIADHTRIDLSDLSDGIYFLNWIQNGGIVSAQKIVLSR